MAYTHFWSIVFLGKIAKSAWARGKWARMRDKRRDRKQTTARQKKNHRIFATENSISSLCLFAIFPCTSLGKRTGTTDNISPTVFYVFVLKKNSYATQRNFLQERKSQKKRVSMATRCYYCHLSITPIKHNKCI